MRGQDQEAPITISLEEAYRGAATTLRLQAMELSPEGALRPKTKQYRVKIPAGVTAGAQIRLAGQGGAGIGGGPAGDLFLRVHIHPHPVFTLEGKNLFVMLPLAPWEAALGTKVEVSTLDGPVNMTVPPGTQSGQQLRLRGKGFPQARGERGDLFVTIQIAVPKALSPEEQQLFEQLASRSSFNPRARREERP